MTARNHFLFWTFIFAAFLALVWLFKSILLPFVIGMVIAYLLNPLVNYLGKLKISRGWAALLILVVFFATLTAALAALAPVLYHELKQFSDDLPGYIDRLWELAAPLTQKIQTLAGAQEGQSLRELAKEHAGSAVGVAGELLGGLAAGGKAVAGAFSLLVIVPIVAFFMMREWPSMTGWAEGLIPPHSKETVMGILKEIDRKLSGFIRGQVSVALLLGIIYAVALSLVGLKYGLLIGFGAGVLSIIPMLGSFTGLLVATVVAWVQSGEWTFVALVAGIFLVGQFVEGNFLTPKIVGGNVGLHPLWIFFALLAGGSIFGILGMLLAVPVAVVISVLSAFAIRQYKNSPYYKGKKNG